MRRFIRENLRLFRGKKGKPASFRLMDRLLADQAYVLAFWQNPNEVINYRRFFTITDLVGVRVEDPFVFEATHGVIQRLVERGLVTGLRIDHIDGLRDPLGYLRRLQERVGRNGADPRGFYVIAEKILSASEELPRDWPVCGTTGYDFLNAVNRLFVDSRGAGQLERIYTEFLDKEIEYDVLYQKKKLVMATILAVEMRSLARQLDTLAEQDRYARDLPRPELAQALNETTACLSVYWTYVRSLEVTGEAKAQVEAALERARRRRPNCDPACFDFVREVLLLEDAEHLLPEQREARLSFVMRWQQFTGPIVAKGLEDTALYVYNPLISLNEVGGDPKPVTAANHDFHRFLKGRARLSPYTLNATTTHDTKRAEDVRARVNVLSETPGEWRRHLNHWARLNAVKKATKSGQPAPDRNEEISFYQTLLGAWPLNPDEIPQLKTRLQAYVVKATREAMVHTRWTRPNLEHERALTEFVESVLSGGQTDRFLRGFLKFQSKIAYYGMVNGLAQVLLKITSPGVPDFYQGSELWDFRLVDPDNRGPVDFNQRAELLRSLQDQGANAAPVFAQHLWENWGDGRIKLYVIWKALNFRRQHPGPFLDGKYLPAEARGPRKENVFAFIRSAGDQRVIAAVPRWLARSGAPMSPEGMRRYWGASQITLSAQAPSRWLNVLTGDSITCGRRAHLKVLPLRELFGSFPVALLWADLAGQGASRGLGPGRHPAAC